MSDETTPPDPAPATAGGHGHWAVFKQDYLRGGGSLRGLAAKHRLSFHTAAKHARREGWAAERRRLRDTVATTMATSALQAAAEQGREIGLTAASLLARQIRDTNAWLTTLTRMQEQVAQEPPKARTIKDVGVLTAAHDRIMRLARLAHPELESPAPVAGTVNVGAVRNLVIQMSRPPATMPANAPNPPAIALPGKDDRPGGSE